MVYSYSHSKVIVKISQAKGLRDPSVGVPLSPLVFIGGLGMRVE